MGNVYSQNLQSGKPPLIPEEVTAAEVTILRRMNLCSTDLRNEINEDLKVMVMSLNLDPNKFKPSIFQSFGRGEIDPIIELELKDALLSKIDEFTLAERLKTRFYDYNLMSVLSCLYGNLWIIDRNLYRATDSVSKYFRIRKNLSIGEWGVVFKGEKGGSDLSFIIKILKSPAVAVLSIHEAFVAAATLNPLRKHCPNFSFMYGGFVCGQPDVISGTLCKLDSDVPYTVYEAVDGNTIFTYIRNTNTLNDPFIQHIPISIPMQLYVYYVDILSELLQIFFSLKIAQALAYNFAHRDLHTQNVILRPLQTTMWIKYDSKNMMYVNPIEKIKENIGVSAVKEESKKPRTVYYVKSNYVATIIDYDMSEVYLPGNGNVRDGTASIVKFGKPDYDPIGKPISGNPKISEIRDLSKFLGFVASDVNEFKYANQDFKDFLMNLYINCLRPYYTIYNPSRINKNVSKAEKFNVLMQDRKSLFMLSEAQIPYIEKGVITFDSFLTQFKTLTPGEYLNYVYSEFTGPDSEISAYEKKLESGGVKILRCSGDCSVEITHYRELTKINPMNQINIAKSNPENLVYYARDSIDSINKFRDSKLRMKIGDPGSPILPIQDINKSKLEYTLKSVGQNDIQKIKQAILEKIKNIDQLSNKLRLPVLADFFKLYGKDLINGVYVYKKFLLELFSLVNETKELISLNNGLVILNSKEAIDTKPLVIKYVNAVSIFFSTEFKKWKADIIELINKKYYKQHNYDMSVLIMTGLPDEIIFEPIM